MAKQVLVTCDLCGSEPAVTVNFSIEGEDPWDRDMCEGCLARLRVRPPGKRQKFSKVRLPPQPHENAL